MVVIVECNITTGLVQHRKEGTQAAQACEVHNVLQLRGMFQGLDHQACRGEVRLQNPRHITLDLLLIIKNKTNHQTIGFAE